jgi:hydrogenase maturation protein HypF
VLTEAVVERFAERGVRVLLPRQAPPGDGGLSLGQAWVGALKMKERGGD